MPRLARKVLGTSFFHIVVQGINREYIFRNNEYIEKYKSLMLKYSKKYNVNIIAYCIMNNHAHILVYVDKIQSMSEFMRSLNTTYGHYYNKVESRVGIVFRNRYESQPIYNEQYLYSCIVYIHNNPVKAKIVEAPEKYKYSSYKEYINKTGIITKEVLKLVFGTTKEYLNIFLELEDNELEFVDYNKEKEDIKFLVKDYCNKIEQEIEDVKSNKENLRKLIKYLVKEKQISQSDIAKELNVNRLKICRLIKHEQK